MWSGDETRVLQQCLNLIRVAVYKLVGYTCQLCLPPHPGDDTLKLWDIRAFKTPVGVVDDLENNFSGYVNASEVPYFFTIMCILPLLFAKQTLTMSSCSTDCVFSPDEKVIMTGTSVRKGQVGRDQGT